MCPTQMCSSLGGRIATNADFTVRLPEFRSSSSIYRDPVGLGRQLRLSAPRSLSVTVAGSSGGLDELRREVLSLVPSTRHILSDSRQHHFVIVTFIVVTISSLNLSATLRCVVGASVILPSRVFLDEEAAPGDQETCMQSVYYLEHGELRQNPGAGGARGR